MPVVFKLRCDRLYSWRQEQEHNSFKDKQKPALESTAQWLVAHWWADWQTYVGCLQEFNSFMHSAGLSAKYCEMDARQSRSLAGQRIWNETILQTVLLNLEWVLGWSCGCVGRFVLPLWIPMLVGLYDPNYGMNSVQCTVTCSSPPPAQETQII